MRPTNGRVSGEKVEGTWHFSRVHFFTEDLPSQTKMEASSEGNFSVSMNTSSSAPFREERLGLYTGGGGVHVKIQMGMLIKFSGLKFGQILFSFLRGLVSKTGAVFGLRKSFKCTFSRGRVGPRPLPERRNVTIQMGMLVQFFGFEI